jgi:hypothetical protein
LEEVSLLHRQPPFGLSGGTSLHAPNLAFSLGLNIGYRLASTAGFEPPLRLRHGDLPLITAFKGATSHSKPAGVWRMSVSKQSMGIKTAAMEQNDRMDGALSLGWRITGF